MAHDGTQRVMDAYLETLLAGGDFASSFSPDVVWTFMESGDEIQGRDAVRDAIVDLHAQAFAAHPELRQLLVGDGHAMVEVVFIGTHTGDFLGVPATGVEVRAPYCVAYDIADGAITALRAYFPTTGLRSQLAEAAQAAATPAHV